MDPNTALEAIRQSLDVLNREPTEDFGWTEEELDDRETATLSLSWYVTALDDWLSKGGFFPDAWTLAFNKW